MDELIEPRFQVVVHNKVKGGYRRAGFALQKGPNLLMGVTETQIAALRADPRLVFGSQDPMPTESIEKTEKRLQGNTDGSEKSRLENSPLPADLTVEQLKAKLAELGVNFDKKAKKADLVALLETATQATEPKEDE
ncbi:Mu-like prophage FluMu protein gp35 [[Actinobacillus] rossii]|uniref:Mu-like prophage FluMu protein gp35 n=1 Tax=[Actinobacillus] rossii TaxID=123820 RepID=A0A380TQL3_9PAST|nr:Mu-like prophage FluMu protein gp35 [[Actinobacillus] rossii]